jgi:copper chaperone CopZ
MKNITLKSADIHCDACANSIQNTVGKLDGVEHLAVDVAAQAVTVYFDPPVTEDQIRETMDDAGFEVIEEDR